MKVEIDQSIKIEQTNKSTAVGLSNSIKVSVGIPGKEKKLVQKYFRDNSQPRLFVVLTFSALVAYAIKEAGKLSSEITIDREYPGYDELIKEKIVAYLDKLKVKLRPELLSIGLVGKESGSHSLAYRAAKSSSWTLKLTAKNILFLVQTKNRRVLKKRLSRLVGTPSGFYDKSVPKNERKVKRKR